MVVRSETQLAVVTAMRARLGVPEDADLVEFVQDKIDAADAERADYKASLNMLARVSGALVDAGTVTVEPEGGGGVLILVEAGVRALIAERDAWLENANEWLGRFQDAKRAMGVIAAMECQHGSGTRSFPCPVCAARKAIAAMREIDSLLPYVGPKT